jgi:hypothetical protein
VTHRFKSGAPLGDESVYIERAADEALAQTLLAGDLCHIFGPRQLGKSSLYQRCARRVLRPSSVRCATLDLTAIVCDGISPEEFFFGLSEVLAREFDIPDPLPFWQGLTDVPVKRWTRFLREIVLKDQGPPIVVFIDEIDKLFDTGCVEDFLTGLCSVREDYPRFTFCLVGVAAMWELTSKLSCSLISRSRPIELLDFTRPEADGFLKDLSNVGGSAGPLLQAIYDWTAGHPAMMQRLGGLLEQEGVTDGDGEAEKVQQLVEQFLLTDGRIQDGALNYAERHFDKRNPEMLSERILLYKRLLHDEAIPAQKEDPVQGDLWLAGIAAFDAERATLRIRNRIVSRVFDRHWLDNLTEGAFTRKLSIRTAR